MKKANRACHGGRQRFVRVLRRRRSYGLRHTAFAGRRSFSPFNESPGPLTLSRDRVMLGPRARRRVRPVTNAKGGATIEGLRPAMASRAGPLTALRVALSRCGPGC